jgi:hypothetical protein
MIMWKRVLEALDYINSVTQMPHGHTREEIKLFTNPPAIESAVPHRNQLALLSTSC